MTHLEPGARIEPRNVSTADGREQRFPYAEGVTHLQLRRFAGCPICGEHLRPFAERAEELNAAGVQEMIVFKSDAAHVRRFEGALPFDTLPDPDGHWYAELGVRSTAGSLLNLRAVWAFVAGVARNRSLRGSLTLGDHLGLPADFLLTQDGTVLGCYYGTGAADGWSVDEVLQPGGFAPTGVRAVDRTARGQSISQALDAPGS